MKNQYSETFEGQALVRNEPPRNTWNWLTRREELTGNTLRRAREALAAARQAGVKPRQMPDLLAAVEQADKAHSHARDTRAAFALRWTSSAGYVDPSDGDSAQKPQPAAPVEAEPLPPAIDDEEASEDIDVAESIRRPARMPRRDGLPHPAPAPARRVVVEAPAVKAAALPPDRLVAPQPVPPPPSEPPLASQALTAENPAPVPPSSDAVTEPSPPPARPPAPPQSEWLAEPEPRQPASPSDPVVVKSYKGLKDTPPDEFKFKKGEPSRNPNGRPKGAKNLKTVIKEVFGQKLKLQGDDGRWRTITLAAAIFEVQARQALEGDTRALGIIATLLGKYWNDEEVPEKTVELTAEERSILKNRLLMLKLIDPDEDDGEDKS